MLDFDNIPLDDEKTYKLLAEGKTYGVFQLETSLGRHWAKYLQPRNLEDIAALVSVIRPSCLKAMVTDYEDMDINNNDDLLELAKNKDIIKVENDRLVFERRKFESFDEIISNIKLYTKLKSKVEKTYTASITKRFCDRKNGREKITYPHPELEPILKNTCAMILFQEQVLQLAQLLAGFNLETSDLLRVAIGKKKAELMSQLKSEFVDGCVKVGKVDKDKAEEIFGWIEKSQRYGFNLSHSVGYAHLTYFTAFCKANYPLQFYCARLRGSNQKIDKYEEVKALYADARSSGIDVCLPDLRDKKNDAYIKNGKIYFGLSDIKFVGAAALHTLEEAEKEVEERLGRTLEKWLWADYLIYFSDLLASDTNKALISAGTLDYMQVQRQEMLYQFDMWSLLTNKEKEFIRQGNNIYNGIRDALIYCSPAKKDGGGCHSQTRSSKLRGFLQQLETPPHSLRDVPDQLAWLEEKYLGVSISFRRSDVGAPESNISCKEFSEGKGKEYVVFSAEVDDVKKIKTKNGDNPGQSMAIFNISDRSGQLEGCVCFPDQWREFGSIIYMGNTLKLQGNRNRKGGFTLQKCWEI